MSKNEKEYATEASMENVENALSKTEQFIEDNQKTLTIIMFAIIIAVGGYWGAKKLYFLPQTQKAQAAMFYAQNYFEKDSFNLALNGDGMYDGFLDVADSYSITKPGKLANYYAGICYLRLGEFENAVDKLSGFSSDDEILNANAQGALGDAHLELGNTDKAISHYKNAADLNDVTIAPVYLLKLGLVLESQKNYSEALEVYTKIKDEHSKSTEARTIDKYIARATVLSKN